MSPISVAKLSVRVYLAGRDPAGLRAYATQVSTPGDALYGRYLTAGQVRSRFGPTRQQIAAVKTWLTGSGMTVTSVNDKVAGYVDARGSLAAAARAFDVTFGSFTGPDQRTDLAPEQDASAPASVGAAVLAVAGLDTAHHYAKPADTLPPPWSNTWTAPPCSQYFGQQVATDEPTAYGAQQPWSLCGYTPRQIRSVYGVTASGMTGKGQTVAIVDAYASSTMLSDANAYAKHVGDPPFAPGQYQEVLPSTFTDTSPTECYAQSWYQEEALDVEAVHGQAPDAAVRYVAAASCSDVDLASALSEIVDGRLASIVSCSWGELDDVVTLRSEDDQIFQAGAAEGIGFFFSSGDAGYNAPEEGDYGSDRIQVDYPTSSPWVTSVGGTSLAIGATDNYEFETSWGTLADPLGTDGTSWQSTPPGPYPGSYDGSGGGGVSTTYQQPVYQRGVVPASLATHLPSGATSATPMRVVPDVAAFADPNTGMLIGETALQPDGKTYAFSLSRIGGTSVACPTFAGIEADAQQLAGHPLGFANPEIYQRYGTSAFRDVTDHPMGPGNLAEVRNDYAHPGIAQGPLLTHLETLGIDGEGAEALPAVAGYDDATGVGTPLDYVESIRLTASAAGGGSQSAPVDGGFASPLQVKVVDASGDPASGVPVTFTAPAGNNGADPTATFAGETSSVTVRTSGQGIAAAPVTANQVAGSYQVTAAAPALASWSADFALTNLPASHTLVIDSLRFGGPDGAGDSYVDLVNASGVPFSPAGWTLRSDTCRQCPTLPSSTPVLQPGQHYLVVGGKYSLGGYASADFAPGEAIKNATGFTVLATDPSGATAPSDAVGLSRAPAGLRAGTGLASPANTSTQYAYVRNEIAGKPVDTGHNAADFTLVSTDPAALAGSTLGAPHPRDMASPTQDNKDLRSVLFDKSVRAPDAPNRVYDPATHTLTVRRTITNTGSAPVDTLRIRLSSISTVGVPGTHAVLRWVSSSTDTVNGTTVQGLALDTPPTQPDGGGLDSTATLTPDHGLPGGGLAPGESVSVAFQFSVDQGGHFWFGYDVAT